MTSHAQPVKPLIVTVTSPEYFSHDELLYIVNETLPPTDFSTLTERFSSSPTKSSGKFPCQKVLKFAAPIETPASKACSPSTGKLLSRYFLLPTFQ
jgi:hypothetical protein